MICIVQTSTTKNAPESTKNAHLKSYNAFVLKFTRISPNIIIYIYFYVWLFEKNINYYFKKSEIKKEPLRDSKGSKMSKGNLCWYPCSSDGYGIFAKLLRIHLKLQPRYFLEESQTWSFHSRHRYKTTTWQFVFEIILLPRHFLGSIFTVPVSAKRSLRCNWAVNLSQSGYTANK